MRRIQRFEYHIERFVLRAFVESFLMLMFLDKLYSFGNFLYYTVNLKHKTKKFNWKIFLKIRFFKKAQTFIALQMASRVKKHTDDCILLHNFCQLTLRSVVKYPSPKL